MPHILVSTHSLNINCINSIIGFISDTYYFAYHLHTIKINKTLSLYKAGKQRLHMILKNMEH